MAEVSCETGQRRPCRSGSRAAPRSPAAGRRPMAPPAGPRKAARRRRGARGGGEARRGCRRGGSGRGSGLPSGLGRGGSDPGRAGRRGRAAEGGGGEPRAGVGSGPWSGRLTRAAVRSAPPPGIGVGGERPILGRLLDCSAESGLRHCPAGVSRPGPRLSGPPAAPPDQGLRGQREQSGTLAPKPLSCGVPGRRETDPHLDALAGGAARESLYPGPDLGVGAPGDRGCRAISPGTGELGEGAA